MENLNNQKKWLLAPNNKNIDVHKIFPQVINKLKEDPDIQEIKVISENIPRYAVFKTTQVTVNKLKMVLGDQFVISLDESLDQFNY